MLFGARLLLFQSVMKCYYVFTLANFICIVNMLIKIMAEVMLEGANVCYQGWGNGEF